MVLETSTGKVIALIIALFLLRLLFSYLNSPLRSFPGPFWAQFTDLWRVLDYWRCTQIQSHQQLHERFGLAVRIGPNMISLSDPSLLKTVYSTRGDFVKSNFYEVADAVSNGHRIENVFSTRSNTFHSRYMKPYQKYFAMNTILEKEPLADKMVISLCQQLENRFVYGHNAGKTAPLADWIEYCAWDLDWELTFSQDMGFFKSGTDVKNMIHTGEMIMRYLGCIGQMPLLDRLLGKNPYCPIKFATFENAAIYSFQRVMERVASQDAKPRQDFLDNFLEAKQQYPDIVSDNDVVSYLMMNVLAGADTTAIVMKAITYNGLTHPSVFETLRAELDAAQLSFPPSYKQTNELPYLNAVIKEGMRMHPVIGGILERVVPDCGLTLPDGRVIAPGTKVGINPWVSSRNKDVYGKDSDKFRPERWLCSENEDEDAYLARLKRMNDADFTFGSGKRVCVGRNMANLEIHKVISTLFGRYDIQLDHADKGWSPRWWWFTFIDNIDVKIQRRHNVASVELNAKDT
ncbi:cytochrome P450 [Ilyonectria sp. MPI-CAGE-AT-0026]|nr:cytochrome P450 [Ilyonectria sp. MPI-CAGE-AT-0026]